MRCCKTACTISFSGGSSRIGTGTPKSWNGTASLPAKALPATRTSNPWKSLKRKDSSKECLRAARTISDATLVESLPGTNSRSESIRSTTSAESAAAADSRRDGSRADLRRRV